MRALVLALVVIAAPARAEVAFGTVAAIDRVIQPDGPVCERASATPTVTMAPLVTAPATAMPSPPKSTLRWYGGWTLLADGASLATLPVFVGVGGYVVAAPIVHWSRGNVGRGFLSLGTRLSFPLIGYTAVCSLDGSGCSGIVGGLGVILGLSGGALAAMVFDATVLAWDSGPAPKPRPIAWAPGLAIDRSATVLGLTATF